VLVKLGPGAMFGEMAFIFEKDKRSATIVALSEGKLLSITSADFQRLAEEDLKSAHRILLNIAKIIAERLRKTNQDVKKLTTALSIALRRPRKP
jgi:CRP/FNR family cyclic AMP-dependent transcriptional regulator